MYEKEMNTLVRYCTNYVNKLLFTNIYLKGQLLFH